MAQWTEREADHFQMYGNARRERRFPHMDSPEALAQWLAEGNSRNFWRLLGRQHQMRTELISIPTDTLPLDGAFYLPEAEPCGAAMLFHGNTMNFYVGAPRFLPPVL